MLNHFFKATLISVLMLFLTACASLSTGNISTNHPDAYVDGQVSAMSNQELVGLEAMLGGMIMTLNPQGDRVRVELVRYELDQRGYPLTRSGAMTNNRLIVDIFGSVRTNGYAPGDYLTVVGTITRVDDVTIGGEKIRVFELDAQDYEFWRDPRREVYYDDHGFNSPAIRYQYFNNHWGLGFGPYFPYYY